MNIHIITIHPHFIEAYAQFGAFKSALTKDKVKLTVTNLRDYAVDRHGSVDDRPYGGGDGMVMRADSLRDAIEHIPENPYVLLTSAKGKTWKHADAQRLLKLDRPLVLICGRFGGVDERFITKYVDEEISVGDFVLSGGEIPALAIVDSILRLVPGVLGHEDSANVDSFSDQLGGKLEHPLYTKPPVFEGMPVPEVLLSGNHQAIEKWRKEESLLLTQKRRPDLL